MSVRNRLMAGFGATALTPVVTAVVQLASIPLLLHVWGPAKYGDWLVLSAIPSYLALSDLGFGNASGSDMTYRVAQGDQQGALRTFQSSWVLLTVISLLAFLIACAAVWFIPWRQWFSLSSVSSAQAAGVILVLGLFALTTQQTSVLESGYRCDGNFAAGTFWWNIQKFGEAFVATAIALLGGSFIAVAFGYLGSRAVGNIAYAALLFHKTPWLRLGFKYARVAAIKELMKPAAGFIALPAGYAVSLQGFVIAVGALCGPVAAAMFSTTRTLTRLNFQLVNTISRALWPELSSAFGAGNLSLARKLHRYACQASAGLSGASVLFLWILGPALYRLWIHDRMNLDLNCFHLLLVVSVLGSFWNTSSVVPMSTNAHHLIALAFLIASSLSLASVWVLAPTFGITGAALALLFVDSFMCWLVLRTALRQVRDTAAGLVKGMFTSFPLLRILQRV